MTNETLDPWALTRALKRIDDDAAQRRQEEHDHALNYLRETCPLDSTVWAYFRGGTRGLLRYSLLAVDEGEEYDSPQIVRVDDWAATLGVGIVVPRRGGMSDGLATYEGAAPLIAELASVLWGRPDALRLAVL